MTRIKCTSKRKPEKFAKKASGQAKKRAKRTRKIKTHDNAQKIEQTKNIEKEKNTDNAKDAGKGNSTDAEDFVRVRESISSLVRESATRIATEIIKVAVTGQLAPAKYLFEAIGLYPPTAETMTPRPEDSLAHTLLKRMGLPTDPIIFGEDTLPDPLTIVKLAADKALERIRDQPFGGNSTE